MTTTNTEVKPIRLIQVTSENNNKFYNMTPEGNQFLVEYGRVGVTRTEKRYPMSKWNSKLNEKLRGGYKNITDLVKVPEQRKSEFAKIADTTVDTLFNTLSRYAKSSVTENYEISSDVVTQRQVDEAQSIVNSLTTDARKGFDRSVINARLLELYSVIPRRMKNVKYHLVQAAKPADELISLRTIIDAEQKTLDVMAGQVTLKDKDVDTASDVPQKTLLDALGITVEPGTDDDERLVRKFMGQYAREFRAVFRVNHPETREKFAAHVKGVKNKTQELFWHGSRNENWISILGTGLKIRPSNAILTGAMFGNGIYFADKYLKSAGYTSLRGSRWTAGSDNIGFLALLDVHVGKQMEITRHHRDCYTYSPSVLKAKGGYDSVFARGGYDLVNNEYIVYDCAQTTIKYLIQVTR